MKDLYSNLKRNLNSLHMRGVVGGLATHGRYYNVSVVLNSCSLWRWTDIILVRLRLVTIWLCTRFLFVYLVVADGSVV